MSKKSRAPPDNYRNTLPHSTTNPTSPHPPHYSLTPLPFEPLLALVCLLAASILTSHNSPSQPAVLGRSLSHNSPAQLSSAHLSFHFTWYPSLVDPPIITPQPHPRNSPFPVPVPVPDRPATKPYPWGPRMHMERLLEFSFNSLRLTLLCPVLP